MPLKSESRAKYTIGEKLLCYHGPLLYEAKCIEIQELADVRYLIHYQGWNKTWDEWVSEARILKFNEAGIKKQKELQETYKESKKKKDNKKKTLTDKKKSSRSLQDRPRFMGSASETSNRSFGESEDGKASKITTEDENLEIKTDAGTSVMSEELDDQKSSIKDKSITSSKTGSGGRSRKRRLSNCESKDGDKTTLSTTAASVTTVVKDKQLLLNEDNNLINNNEATNSNKSTDSSKSKKSRLVPLDESVLDLDTYVTGINTQILKFVFTDKLRMWLADDWDLITRQSRLSRLPTRMSVDDVLRRYRSYCEKLTMEEGDSEALFNKNREMRLEFIEGIRKYFNTSLGSLLLYKFERQQYFEVVNNNDAKLDMSSIYGSTYILRLLVNIKKLISYTRTDVPSIDCLSDLIQHLIEYMDANANDFFKLEDYITATADYTRRAMC